MSSTVVLAATTLAARLEPAARAIGATGVCVWGRSRDGRFLNALASHGYGESFLAGIGPIPVDAPVMTAMVFAEHCMATRRQRGLHPAAIAAPVVSHGQTIGVLTAEFDRALVVEVSPEIAAQVEALASQMALLVITATPEAGRPAQPDDWPHVAGKGAKRTTRLAPVRPLTAAMSAAIEHPAPLTPEPPVDSGDDPEDALRQARSRFVSGFHKRCTTLEELVAEVEQIGSDGPVLALKLIVHRLSSVASVVGFAGVSHHAIALDRLLEGSPTIDIGHVRRVIAEMQEAFTDDLAGVPPLWAAPPSAVEGAPVPRAGGGLMSSEAFVVAARELLRQGPAALGLVRIAPSAMSDVAALFSDDLRRKDLLGRYSETQLVVLLPGSSAGVAAKRIGHILDTARAAGLEQACAGLAASGQSAEPFIEPLLAQAEAALSAAQVQGRPVVLYGAGTVVNQATVLVVDDDPDVAHIVDARLTAAGHKTVLAFDGQAGLDAVDAYAPAVMVLDLMMPKRSGFDVLARLREQPEPRPRVIVVSSRSREEDVMRAFKLGADDYLTKPFSPQELLARVGRLLR